MSLLTALSTDSSIKDETDSVGSGGPLDSDLYLGTVTLPYINKTKSGAMALNLTLKTNDGRDVRQTLWVTGGDAKGNKNYYEKDGKKNYLPGFIHANALALLTTGKEISELDTEEKVVKIYSFEAKSEVPTKVNMVMDLLNKEIAFGLIKQTVDKNVKSDSGEYVPSGETRDENEIDKFFRASDLKTTSEIRAKEEEATFVNTWKAKWQGQTRNRAKGSKGAGTSGMPAAAAAAAKRPTTSLFG